MQFYATQLQCACFRCTTAGSSACDQTSWMQWPQAAAAHNELGVMCLEHTASQQRLCRVMQQGPGSIFPAAAVTAAAQCRKQHAASPITGTSHNCSPRCPSTTHVTHILHKRHTPPCTPMCHSRPPLHPGHTPAPQHWQRPYLCHLPPAHTYQATQRLQRALQGHGGLAGAAELRDACAGGLGGVAEAGATVSGVDTAGGQRPLHLSQRRCQLDHLLLQGTVLVLCGEEGQEGANGGSAESA